MNVVIHRVYRAGNGEEVLILDESHRCLYSITIGFDSTGSINPWMSDPLIKSYLWDL